MICVIDSSVWISAFRFDGVPLQALGYSLRVHRIAVCSQILHEVHATLHRKFRWPDYQIEDVFSDYIPYLIEVRVHGKLHGICRDPNDDMVLECAVLAKADIIISGDKDLLSLGSYEGIRILTPREFLDLQANDNQLLP